MVLVKFLPSGATPPAARRNNQQPNPRTPPPAKQQRPADRGRSALTPCPLFPAGAGQASVKVAWVGDSRVVSAKYLRGAEPTLAELSKDHKADSPEEMERIEKF